MAKTEIKPSVDMVTFANHKIFNELGEPVKVGTLWQNQQVMFVFLRHFGCVGCRAVAVQIWAEKEKYQKNGTKIIFVSNGAPNFIQGFKEDLNIKDAPVMTDPELVAFRACGFRRGFLAAIGPKSLVKGLQLMADGHKNKYEEGSGDYWQLGGLLVVRADGSVAYHYISQALGDYPEDY